MHSVRRRIATTLAASAVAIGGMTAMIASPAYAATCQSFQEKRFDTPGSDTWVKIQLCVEKVATSTHRAYANVQWEGDFQRLPTRFEKFVLKLRLERNDADMDVLSCNLKNPINEEDNGSERCDYATSYSTADGGWTADGSVTYNINNDGEGDQDPWGLTGTPKIN